MTFTSMFRISAYFIILSGVLVFESGRKTFAWIAIFLGISGFAWLLRRARIFLPVRTTNDRVVGWAVIAVAVVIIMLVDRGFYPGVFHILFVFQLARFFGANKPVHYTQAASLTLLPFIFAASAPKNALFFPIFLYFVASGCFFLVMRQIYAHLSVRVARESRRGKQATRMVLMQRLFDKSTSFNRVALFSLSAMAYALVVGTFLFLVLPRPAGPRGIGGAPEEEYGSRFDMPSRPSGTIHWPEGERDRVPGAFRDRIILGRPRELGDWGDQRYEIATVKFSRGGVPVKPPAGRLYFKGAVLDFFDGARWARYDERSWRVSDRADGTADGRVQFGAGPGLWDSWLRQEYSVRRSAGELRFYIETLEGVEGDKVYIDSAGTLQKILPDNGSGYLRHYTVYSRPSPVARWLYREDLPDKYFEIPPTCRRVKDLARSVALHLSRPAEKAHALVKFLRSRCSYSKRFETGDSPLDTFLFETRQGNCEFFATALAVMLRAVDVPTRVVVGFASKEGRLGPEGEELIVLRQDSGHAWVEVHLPETGWVRFDPTPGGGDGPAVEGQTPEGEVSNDEVEALSLPEVTPDPPAEESDGDGFLDMVRDYNRLDQKALVRLSADTARDAVDLLGTGLGGVFRLWHIFIGLAVMVAAAVAYRRWGGRLGVATVLGRRRGPGGGCSSVDFYGRLLVTLKDRGFKRRANQTAAEFATEVCSRDSALTDPVWVVTHAFHEARYRDVRPDAECLCRVSEAIARIGVLGVRSEGLGVRGGMS